MITAKNLERAGFEGGEWVHEDDFKYRDWEIKANDNASIIVTETFCDKKTKFTSELKLEHGWHNLNIKTVTDLLKELLK